MLRLAVPAKSLVLLAGVHRFTPFVGRGLSFCGRVFLVTAFPLFCASTKGRFRMIQHCVFMRLKAAVTPAEKQSLFEAVAALKQVIPGILDVKYGPNVSPEGLHGGFVDGFIVTFDSLEARDGYLVHPQHVAVGERIVSSSDGGLAGLLVFDLNA